MEETSLVPEENASALVYRRNDGEKFERAQRLKEELFARLLAIKEPEDGWAMKFLPDEEMMLLIHEHVRTGWRSCPFFRFDLHYPSDHASLWVHFKGGPKVNEMLHPKIEEMKDVWNEEG